MTSDAEEIDTEEVEWQFDALDLRPVLRWLGKPEGWTDAGPVEVDAGGAGVPQVDLYLETDDWRFQRAGYALRIRRVGRRRGAEATLKGLDSASPDVPGLRRRREVCERLEEPDPQALLRSGGPVGRRVRAVAGRKPLLPLFEVRTRRRTFSLLAPGLPPGEVALDEVAINPPVGGPPARLRRVEIEVPRATLQALAPFVERLRDACALQPAGLNKYEAGLLSSDLRPSPPERFGTSVIEPEMTIGAVALAVLRRHFSALLAKEPGTRLGDDIEELHDMRVASRRLRAALSLFADVLPATLLRAREELGWVGQTLGAVRDLDVQIEQLDSWIAALEEEDRDALATLRSLLQEQREAARAGMIEMLDSRRYEAFVSRFGRALRARQPSRTGRASLPARALAPDLIESRFRPVRRGGARIGPDSPAADYHRLRIDCKRLRYALEFLGDLYPGETRPLIRRLVTVQDILGLHQDADIAVERLRRLALSASADLEPGTIFAMGEVAERYRQSMIELRARFPAAFARLSRRRWKAFRAVLESERPAPSGPAADLGAKPLPEDDAVEGSGSGGPAELAP
jgi:CHAD domain-containing protein